MSAGNGTMLSEAQALAYVQAAALVAGIPMPADRAQRVAFQLQQISRMAGSLNDLDLPPELELAEIYQLPRSPEASSGPVRAAKATESGQ